MATRKTVKVESAERTEICRECRFMHFTKNDGMRCRRFPPVFVYDYATGVSTAQWPEINPDAHCGEFKGKLSS